MKKKMMASERSFPACKPPPPPPASGGAANCATATRAANGAANQKTQVYLPAVCPPYRPLPHTRKHNHRKRRRSGCRTFRCCCIWSIPIITIVVLLAAIAATALFVIYNPRRPSFSIPSLRVHRLNLTTDADFSISHLSSLFNFTLLAENPNHRLTFSYDPFAVTITSATSGVFLGNGTVPAFSSDKGNQTSLRAVIAASTESRVLDADEVTVLKSELKKKSVKIQIQMDTKMKLQIGRVKIKRVPIIVTCEGLKGAVPMGKARTLATTDKSNCKVDLGIKILRLLNPRH